MTDQDPKYESNQEHQGVPEGGAATHGGGRAESPK